MPELDQGTVLPDGAQFAIFTDFDGTLVEIAATPDEIVVPPALVVDLNTAAERLDGALMVVTGRSLADIQGHLPGLDVAVVGGHGSEISQRGDLVTLPHASASASAAGLAGSLGQFVEEHPELLLERKPSGVALHYRRAPEMESMARLAMLDALQSTPDLVLLEGKMVFEARPAGFGKGRVVVEAMARPPFSSRLPVFLGDDVTDEDGFLAAQELGGFGVKIGDGETRARLRVANVAAARGLIARLADLPASGDAA